MAPSAEIDAAYAAGKAAWPAIEIPVAQLATMATAVGADQQGLQLWAADFYLACAAANGHEPAMAIIDQRFVRKLAPRIKRLGAPASSVADILQVIRERLFTGPRPRIAAYNAAGPLEQWIKVVGIRTAIDLHRKETPVERARIGVPKTVGEPTPDPTAQLTKDRYKLELQQVLKRGIQTLSTRDRTVLRLHLVDGLSIEKIATTQGVHRVTVARWIWNAGEILLDGVRRHFKDHHGMVPSECDSLAHLVQSQISLDLPGILGSG